MHFRGFSVMYPNFAVLNLWLYCITGAVLMRGAPLLLVCRGLRSYTLIVLTWAPMYRLGGSRCKGDFAAWTGKPMRSLAPKTARNVIFPIAINLLESSGAKLAGPKLQKQLQT